MFYMCNMFNRKSSTTQLETDDRFTSKVLNTGSSSGSDKYLVNETKDLKNLFSQKILRKMALYVKLLSDFVLHRNTGQRPLHASRLSDIYPRQWVVKFFRIK
jgi:hypothetical protein